MKPDRPLILAVVSLASGLGLVFGYCHGTAGVSAAFPLAGCSVHLCTTTNGPGALGGLALILLGALLLLWTCLLAIAAQFRGFVPGHRAPQRAESAPRSERPGQ